MYFLQKIGEDQKKINFLFKLIVLYFKEIKKCYLNQGIKLNIFGELNKLPDIKSVMLKSTKFTQNNKKIIVNLAINYGSKE